MEQIGATQFIQVTYKDSSPKRAQRVANAIGEVFSKKVSSQSSATNAISATIWERAALPDEPVSPNPMRNGLLTLVVALMLGVGLALLLNLLDDSWHSPEEVEQITGALTIGAIPQYSTAKDTKMMRVLRDLILHRAPKMSKSKRNEQPGRLATILDPMSAASEAYRTLRTNLLYASVDDPPKVVVVTSSGSREGKSSVCSNLGVVLAQAGKNTLIVDCDFRKPAVHRFFDVRNLYGLGDILIGERGSKEVWIEPLANLKVISVGPIPPNPTELLDSQSFANFLASMRHEFDYVLIDSAPVSSVSDAAIIASRSDGILLVVDTQYTRKTFVRQAMRSLAPVGATVLGTVMNNVEDQEGNHYHSSYTY